MKKSFDILINAFNELKENEKFFKFLGLVLTVGNLLNGKIAYSFKISTLTKLIDTKSYDGKTRLIDYLIQQCSEKKELRDLYEIEKYLKWVREAKNQVNLLLLENDIISLQSDLDRIRRLLVYFKNDKDFYEKINPFYNEAVTKMMTLNEKKIEMKILMKDICELYVIDENQILKESDNLDFFGEICKFLQSWEEGKQKILIQKEKENLAHKKAEREEIKKEEKLKEEKIKEEERVKSTKREGRGQIQETEDMMSKGAFTRRRKKNSFKEDNTPITIGIAKDYF